MNEDEILEFNYKTPKRNGHDLGCPCYTCRLEESFRKTKKRLNDKKAGKKVTIKIPRIDIPKIFFGSSRVSNLENK